MPILKDYTNQTILNSNGINVQILDLNNKEKNKDSVWNYICPYCGEISISTINHIKRGDGCCNCRYIRSGNNQKKSQDEFIKELSMKQPNLIVIGEYKNYNSKVEVFCSIHGNNFYGVPANLLKSNFSCPLCIIRRNINRSLKYTLDYVKEWLNDNNLMMVNDCEYKNAGSSFEYKCLICGNTGRINFGNLLRGRKCKGCLGLNKKNTSQFKQEVFDLVGKEYDVLGEYTGNKDNILIRHNVCGHEYYVIPTNFLYRLQRCPKCLESKGEKRISEYLDLLNIKYDQEYKFKDCKHITNLRFDFFLPKLNVLIEYQGKQHYESVDFMGGQKDFKLRKIRDEIKRDYCKKNNYKLIEISYLDYENIEKIIHKALIDIGAFVA
jgi:hypothetical protein